MQRTEPPASSMAPTSTAIGVAEVPMTRSWASSSARIARPEMASRRPPLPVSSIALHVSRGTAQNRLDRLIQAGVILGFTVRVRPDIDERLIRALMTIQLAGKTTTAVIARLRGIPEIRALHTTNGTWDLIAEIGVDTLPDLDRALGTIRAIDGIRGSETSILLTSM
jgi:DNA-binding Lrp family transcriptional regulator